MKPGIRCGPGAGPGQPAHDDQPDADQQQAGADEPAGGHVLAEPAGDRRGDELGAADDGQPQARVLRRVAQHVLQVDDQVEQHGVERAVHRERGDRAAGEGRRAQQRQVEHGVRDAPLGHDEPGQRHAADRQADDDAGVGPAVLAGPDQPVDQADQAGGQQREPGPVGRRRGAATSIPRPARRSGRRRGRRSAR